MKILVTGARGQVGWELQRTLAPLGEVVALDRSGMDLADPDSVRRAIRDTRPDIIVNAAAYTAVDKAETERDLALSINAVAPGVIAEEATRIKAALIHYSTDYVFDGTKTGPYTEDDVTNPLSVYGKTKLAGEQAIIASGAAHVILRTSWVYATRGKNFLLTIRRVAAEREELRIVDDQTGAPTWCRMLAQATAQIIAGCGGTAGLTEKSGVYHLTAGGQTTWFGFACAIVAHARTAGLPGSPRLVPITTAEYPLPAPRPSNSVLSNRKIMQTFGVVMPEWDRAFALCADQ